MILGVSREKVPFEQRFRLLGVVVVGLLHDFLDGLNRGNLNPREEGLFGLFFLGVEVGVYGLTDRVDEVGEFELLLHLVDDIAEVDARLGGALLIHVSSLIQHLEQSFSRLPIERHLIKTFRTILSTTLTVFLLLICQPIAVLLASRNLHKNCFSAFIQQP